MCKSSVKSEIFVRKEFASLPEELLHRIGIIDASTQANNALIFEEPIRAGCESGAGIRLTYNGTGCRRIAMVLAQLLPGV
jgi:hypothetical protein